MIMIDWWNLSTCTLIFPKGQPFLKNVSLSFKHCVFMILGNIIWSHIPSVLAMSKSQHKFFQFIVYKVCFNMIKFLGVIVNKIIRF